MTGTATLHPTFGQAVESVDLLPMNDLDMEGSGYALYSAEVTVDGDGTTLRAEHVRDYAAVYLDGVLAGSLTDRQKELHLNTAPGTYRLDLYVENIGRITYGPEILDNNKGLFGGITVGDKPVEEWTITPLHVRDCDPERLEFSEETDRGVPCFYRGCFEIGAPRDMYLDVSGWGMGEAWVNGVYIGSFWEEERQQSILMPSGCLDAGRNEIIVFELKNNGRTTMELSASPVFK